MRITNMIRIAIIFHRTLGSQKIDIKARYPSTVLKNPTTPEPQQPKKVENGHSMK